MKLSESEDSLAKWWSDRMHHLPEALVLVTSLQLKCSHSPPFQSFSVTRFVRPGNMPEIVEKEYSVAMETLINEQSLHAHSPMWER